MDNLLIRYITQYTFIFTAPLLSQHEAWIQDISAVSRAGVAYLCPDMQVFFFCCSPSFFLSFFPIFFALALIISNLFGAGSHAATLDDVYDGVSSDVPGSSFCSSSSSSSLTLTAPRLVFYVAWAVAQSSPHPPVGRFRLRPGNNTIMYVTGSMERLPHAGLATWNISRCKATHKKNQHGTHGTIF